jgi:hypothetical protein
MEHQTPQELHGLEREGTQAVATLVILVAKSHLAVLQRDEPGVGDGHTVSIAGQVLEDVLGPLEGLLRVDHPFFAAQVGEELVPGRGLSEVPTAPQQGELALRVGLLQTREVEAPEAPREDADGQEEVRPTRDPLGPVGRQPPGGEDTMQMGMITTPVTIP